MPNLHSNQSWQGGFYQIYRLSFVTRHDKGPKTMFPLKNFLNVEHKNCVWIFICTLTFIQDSAEDWYKPTWQASMKFLINKIYNVSSEILAWRVKYTVKQLFDAFLILGLAQVNACMVERPLWTLRHHFRRVLSCTELHGQSCIHRCLAWRPNLFAKQCIANYTVKQCKPLISEKPVSPATKWVCHSYE